MSVSAKCILGPNGKSCDGSSGATGVEGVVDLTQNEGESTVITYKVTGLAPGLHGFHV